MKYIFIFLLIISSAFAQNYDTPHHFPFQDVNKDYHGRWQFVNTGSKLIVFYYDVSSSSGVIASRTSIDNGVTWSEQNNIVGQLEPNGINFSACISSAGRLILVYSRISTSYILYSDDSELTWSAPSQISYCTYPDLNTTPDNKLILSGYSSNSFSISTDNGTSWQRKSLPARANSLDILNQNEYLLHTITSGNIFTRKSTDAGTTWSAQILVIDETNDIDYLSSAVNNEGHSIICYTIPNTYQPDIVSVKSTDAGQSWSPPAFITSYKGYDGFQGFYQNYPNPFNAQTIIKFSLPELSITTLKIYDILGNEVAVILSKEVESGKHEFSFNADNLSSGIYFYQLKSGIHIESRKMILIK